ncbi:MAG: hypothetical protein ACK56F_08920, partial [bacterium]
LTYPQARVSAPFEGAPVSFAALSVPLARALGLHHARPAHAQGAHDAAANGADHRALLRRGGHRLLRMHRAQR